MLSTVISIVLPLLPSPHPSLPSTLNSTPFGFVHVSLTQVLWWLFPYFPPNILQCMFLLFLTTTPRTSLRTSMKRWKFLFFISFGPKSRVLMRFKGLIYPLPSRLCTDTFWHKNLFKFSESEEHIKEMLINGSIYSVDG